MFAKKGIPYSHKRIPDRAINGTPPDTLEVFEMGELNPQDKPTDEMLSQIEARKIADALDAEVFMRALGETMQEFSQSRDCDGAKILNPTKYRDYVAASEILTGLSGELVEYPDVIPSPRAAHEGLSAKFKSICLDEDGVKKFVEFLGYAILVGIVPTISGGVLVETNIPDVWFVQDK
jgi:hypothetical protein